MSKKSPKSPAAVVAQMRHSQLEGLTQWVKATPPEIVARRLKTLDDALGQMLDAESDRQLREMTKPLPPEGFAADSDPPYGDDSEPGNPDYEPIRLPWEYVEDTRDVTLGQARVLNAANELVCTTTPRRARLIVAVVNRHASGFDV